MASVTSIDKMNMAASWPTDYALFEAAKAKAPEYAKQLDYLMEDTEQAMREKDLLDHRVGQVLDLEVMIAYDWPTHIDLFRMAIDKLNSLQDYEISEELDDRWDSVNEKMAIKKNLDDIIVQILNGTFNGGAEIGYNSSDSLATLVREDKLTPPASPGFMEPPPIKRIPSVTSSVLANSGALDESHQVSRHWTEDDYKAHCLPKNTGPYDHLTEKDWPESENETNDKWGKGPWCDYCHVDSQCDGDHSDEMREGFLFRKGPASSPLTLSIPPQQVMGYIDEVDSWAKDLERLIAESKAIREAPLSSFADLASYEDDDTIPEVDIEAA